MVMSWSLTLLFFLVLFGGFVMKTNGFVLFCLIHKEFFFAGERNRKSSIYVMWSAFFLEIFIDVFGKRQDNSFCYTQCSNYNNCDRFFFSRWVRQSKLNHFFLFSIYCSSLFFFYC